MKRANILAVLLAIAAPAASGNGNAGWDGFALESENAGTISLAAKSVTTPEAYTSRAGETLDYRASAQIYPLFGSEGNGGSTTPYALKPGAGEAVYTSNRKYQYEHQAARDLGRTLEALEEAGIRVSRHLMYDHYGWTRYGITHDKTGGLRDIAFYSREFGDSRQAAYEFLGMAERRLKDGGVKVVASGINRDSGSWIPSIQYLTDWKKPSRTVIRYTYSLGGYANWVSDPGKVELARLRLLEKLREAGVDVLLSWRDGMSAEFIYFADTMPVKGGDGDFTYARKIVPIYETVRPEEAEAALAAIHKEVADTGAIVLNLETYRLRDFKGDPMVLIDGDLLKPNVVGRASEWFF